MYVITDECSACGVCAENCPSEAITEGEEKYSIDAEKCSECGLCAEDCPMEAIKTE